MFGIHYQKKLETVNPALLASKEKLLLTLFNILSKGNQLVINIIYSYS